MTQLKNASLHDLAYDTVIHDAKKFEISRKSIKSVRISSSKNLIRNQEPIN